jgi:sugar O-acyltransferase (sialic acid O-acetyltransferase NeuD family)
MSDAKAIPAPRINANDDSVRIVRWLVDPGTWVEPGTRIAEIETTKAVVEVEAEQSGYLAPCVSVGAEVAVGEPLAWLLEKYDPAVVPKAMSRQHATTDGRLVSRDALALMGEHDLRTQDMPGAGPIRRADVERMLAHRLSEPDAADWDRVIAQLSVSADSTVLFGADLQGSVVIDCLEAASPGSATVLVDDNPKRKTMLDRPVLPATLLPKLRRCGFKRAHVAIGSPAAKLSCSHRLKQEGFTIVEIRHPAASVSPFATIGEGCFFGPFTLVGPEARIGSYAQINNCASVAHHAQVGEATRLSDGVRLAGRVIIGERAFLGLGVTVNENISIGADTIIVSGVHIFNHVPADVTVRVDGKAYPNRPRRGA